MNGRQPHPPLVFLTVAAERNRHPPAAGIRAEHVLERIDRADVPPAELHQFIVVPQAAAVGVAVVQDVVDHDAAVGIGRHDGPERRMIDDPAALQAAPGTA